MNACTSCGKRMSNGTARCRHCGHRQGTGVVTRRYPLALATLLAATHEPVSGPEVMSSDGPSDGSRLRSRLRPGGGRRP